MIRRFKNILPQIDESAWVAKTADVIGQVYIAEDASVWFGAALRGDMNEIRVGARSNIQDNAVLHVDAHNPCVLGEDVTVGHGAIVHGATIGSRVLVGMGAIVLDGAIIEDDVIIGAGALVPPGKRISSGSLVIGSPGRVSRQLDERELAHLKQSARTYVEFSKEYAMMAQEETEDEA